MTHEDGYGTLYGDIVGCMRIYSYIYIFPILTSLFFSNIGIYIMGGSLGVQRGNGKPSSEFYTSTYWLVYIAMAITLILN